MQSVTEKELLQVQGGLCFLAITGIVVGAIALGSFLLGVVQPCQP